MKQYSVTTPENLRQLCIEQNWFTCGTNAQYEKLFYANENGCSITGIAVIIWTCSDNEAEFNDILSALEYARESYWNEFFGVNLSGYYRRLIFTNTDGDIMETNLSSFLSTCLDKYADKWSLDSLVRIEEWGANGIPELQTLWGRITLHAEWIPHMKAYRLFNPNSPQKAVEYVADLDKARDRLTSYSIVEIDKDTMHVECQ